MPFTERDRDTIQSIIQIFETGGLSKKGYGIITNLKGDRGGLTYGKHQASLTSGSLYGMLKRYSEHPHAAYGQAFLPYLVRLLNADSSLALDQPFLQLLKLAGGDPRMGEVQDDFFSERYFTPAEAFCSKRGFQQPLTLAIVYDSFIHGSFKRINATLSQATPETVWAAQYVAARRAWLANSSNRLLRNCVYRPDTFANLIKGNRWNLALPITIRGVAINGDPAAFVPPSANPPVMFNSVTTQPLLRKGMRGDEVAYLQGLLILNGFPLTKDADYGGKTFAAVTAFQRSKGLTPDGVVGGLTWDKLDDAL